MKSVTERCIADYLTISDRCLVWLSFIHLTEFDRLPASLYDPANSNPSRVVSIEAFALPWRTPLDVRTEPDTLIALFEGEPSPSTWGSTTPTWKLSMLFQVSYLAFSHNYVDFFHSCSWQFVGYLDIELLFFQVCYFRSVTRLQFLWHSRSVNVVDS